MISRQHSGGVCDPRMIVTMAGLYAPELAMDGGSWVDGGRWWCSEFPGYTFLEISSLNMFGNCNHDVWGNPTSRNVREEQQPIDNRTNPAEALKK
eukprot:scaffold602_cov227-Chaetoceros_neogracile.AAC.1